MDEQHLTAAIAEFARDVSALLTRLADELNALPDDQSLYGPTTVRTPLAERLVRQSLILDEIAQAGGSVTQTTWYEIAAKYGYRGRGLAGFFRQDPAHGLLEMKRNGRVYITKHGRERLAQNRERVDARRAG